ncbi:MAG: hypothetical protein JXQ93_11430 [Flavobacteriaceae bacterium]
MLTNFFGKSKPINFLVLFVLMLLYFTLAFLETFSTINVTFDFILMKISYFFLILLFCFIYGFILSKNKLTLDNSFGYFILVALFGFFPEIYSHLDALIFNIIVLVFIRKILSFRTSKSFFQKLFDSGLWIGILFIIEPFSLLFGVLIYVSVSLFQKTNYQTILIPLIGFMVPLILYFTYCLWIDAIGDFKALFYWYSSFDVTLYLSNDFSIPIIFIGFISLLALIFKTPKVFLIRGNYRKYWILITITFFTAICYITLKNNKEGDELLILFFPASIMISNWIESFKSRFLKEMILISFVILPLILFIF